MKRAETEVRQWCDMEVLNIQEARVDWLCCDRHCLKYPPSPLPTHSKTSYPTPRGHWTASMRGRGRGNEEEGGRK